MAKSFVFVGFLECVLLGSWNVFLLGSWNVKRQPLEHPHASHTHPHRMTANGYQVVYQPLAVVYHQEGTTFGTDASERKQTLMKQNQQVCLRGSF